MKKKLNAVEANMLQCTVLMLVIGLLMIFALNKTKFGIGCLVIAGIFFICFIIILYKQGLDTVEEKSEEKVAETKKTGRKIGEKISAAVDISEKTGEKSAAAKDADEETEKNRN